MCIQTKLLPKISIVTPTYNRANLLERCIKSVVDQEYRNLEFIVIDGNSSDNTRELLNKYNSTITKWISEADSGPMDAVRKGYKFVTGDYVFFLSSDDYLEKGILADAGHILATEQCDVLHGIFIYYDKSSNDEFLCRPWFTENVEIYDNRYSWPSVFLNSFFVKKNIYDNIINSDIIYTFKVAPDFKIYQMLLDANVNFTYLNKVIVHVSAGGISDSIFLGYFEIAAISIDHGCPKINVFIQLIRKLIIRSIALTSKRLGLAFVRDAYFSIFSRNIKKISK